MSLDSSPRAAIAHHASRGLAARTAVDFEIRRGLGPGDVGAIAAQHGRAYAREHGLDSTFEAELAADLYAAAARGWPTRREGVWLVERSGRLLGSLALTDEGDRTGRVRAFLLDPSLRGLGVGRRLLGELIARAREGGYRRLVLGTFSELRAAAHLYREHGFRLVDEEIGPRWGAERLTYQRYEREL